MAACDASWGPQRVPEDDVRGPQWEWRLAGA